MQVELGNEPPLTIDDRADRTPIIRSVSLRWLTGTVLTGLTSIFLMGAALLAALDGRSQFATPPQAMGPEARTALQNNNGSGGKSDRIRPIEAPVSARQVVQISTVSRQGEREIIRLQPFAKIAAPLLVRDEKFAGKVPEYNPLKIFAEGAKPEPAAEAPAEEGIADAEVDGEVALTIVSFPLSDPSVETADRLRGTEVEAIMRDMAAFMGSDVQVAALSYAGENGAETAQEKDPFTALGVRIIPENVTFVGKSDLAGRDAFQDKVVSVDRRDTLASILDRNSVGEVDRDDIIAAMSELVDLSKLARGQIVRIGLAPFDADGGTLRPVRVSIYMDGAHQATVARTDDDSFVRADEPSTLPDAVAKNEPSPGPGPGGMPSIYQAVYATALSQDVPQPAINELIKILSYEVDLPSRIGSTDSFEIVHSLPAGPLDQASPDILYASITLGGVKRQFYRFRAPDDGVTDYYDAEGRSAKKFLMRKPMTAGTFRSGFGRRKHPILGYSRLHAGVDWSAPRGSPIMAAGDGVVVQAGRASGYGNLIVVRHTNGYETAYAHQSSFAKGIQKGSRVRQGQIIGYVGSTGLSTGPHLHYEVRINGTAVDPLRVRLPRGRILQDEMLAAFERERDKIDAVLGLPGTGKQLASR